MNAVVYEPAHLRAYVASGMEPATDGDFNIFDLNDPSTWVLGGGGSVAVPR